MTDILLQMNTVATAMLFPLVSGLSTILCGCVCVCVHLCVWGGMWWRIENPEEQASGFSHPDELLLVSSNRGQSESTKGSIARAAENPARGLNSEVIVLFLQVSIFAFGHR